MPYELTIAKRGDRPPVEWEAWDAQVMEHVQQHPTMTPFQHLFAVFYQACAAGKRGVHELQILVTGAITIQLLSKGTWREEQGEAMLAEVMAAVECDYREAAAKPLATVTYHIITGMPMALWTFTGEGEPVLHLLYAKLSDDVFGDQRIGITPPDGSEQPEPASAPTPAS